MTDRTWRMPATTLMTLLGMVVCGCNGHGKPVEPDTVAVSEVINRLKRELSAFAAGATPQAPAVEKRACEGIATIRPGTATLTLSITATKDLSANVGLAVPLADLSVKGSVNEKDTSKIVLPMRIEDFKPGPPAPIPADMRIAQALANLRADLVKVDSSLQPCFSPDKPLKLTLAFEATHSASGSGSFSLSPVKAGASGTYSSATTQTIEIDMALLNADGQPVKIFTEPAATK